MSFLVAFPREANLDANNLVEFSTAVGKQTMQLSAHDLTSVRLNNNPCVFLNCYI